MWFDPMTNKYARINKNVCFDKPKDPKTRSPRLIKVEDIGRDT